MPDTPKLKIFKTGSQSPANPLEFVMSTPSVDRMGDVVEQDWDLADFLRNPIALYNHDTQAPIGTWERVRVDGGRLLGQLKLAAAGTSDLIDTVRALVEQRVLRAVSVGFMPGEAKALKDGAGYRLSKNRLFECSLVSVPANAEALAITRSLDPSTRRTLFAESRRPEAESVAEQIAQSRASEPVTPVSVSRAKTMTTSEQILQLQANLASRQTEMEDLQAKMFSAGLDDTERQRVTGLAAEIETGQKDLEVLQSMEKALATKAKAAGPVQRIVTADNSDPKHRLGAALHCLLRAHHEHRNPADIAKSIYRDEADVAMVVRAAVDPADTVTSGWASQLVQQTWAGFMDALRDVTIYGRVPGQRLNFDRYGTINVPINTADTLQGGFVAEGAPIPVASGIFTSVQLVPKKLAVITTCTEEILRRSAPSIEAILRNQLVQDTAKALDTALLSINARSASIPAGLQNDTEVGAANTNATAGATVAHILTDIGGIIGRLNAAGMGSSGVWLLNPLRVYGLMYKQDSASGLFPFNQEVRAGTLAGFPILISNHVPSGVAYFVDAMAMVFASDYGPMDDISNQATLHMEQAPTDIVEDDSGAAPAVPVKSMFQTDSTALRLRWGMDWRVARQGGVQSIQSCAW